MAKIMVTAQVGNVEEWEEGFRTHGDLFRKLGAKSPILFGVLGDNEVGIYEEVADLDLVMQNMDSPEVVAAMENEGVNRETVKVFVLDKDVSF